MANRPDCKVVEYSCRLYRRLLLVYPRSHRKEYGPAILQLFRDQCRDAWNAQRVRGLITFWLRVLADLLKTSLLEHLSNLNPTRIMPFSFRPTIKPLPAFFGICALIFVPIFVGIVLITFLMPETYRGTATVLVTRPTSSPDSSWVQTEVQVASSSVVLEQVANRLALRDVWGKRYNNGIPLNLTDAVQILKSRLEFSFVTADRTDNVPIRINAYSDDPGEAAKIANGVVDAYRAFRVEQKRQAGATSMERTVLSLDVAVPQFRPVRPNVMLNVVIGALAAILIGVITAPLVLGFIAWIRRGRTPPTIPQKA